MSATNYDTTAEGNTEAEKQSMNLEPVIWKRRFLMRLNAEIRWNIVTLGFIILLVFIPLIIGLRIMQLPYFAISPGSAQSVNEAIYISKSTDYPTFLNTAGDFSFVTARVTSKLSPFDWIAAKLSPNTRILHVKTLGEDAPKNREERIRVGRIQIVNSQNTATLLALEILGIEIKEIYLGNRIFKVENCADAFNKLMENDIIIAADKVPALNGAQLNDILATKSVGDSITLTVQRNGETKDISIILGSRNDSCLSSLFEGAPPSTNQVAIGISIDQLIELDLPIDVEFSTGNIGGPSAGLAFTLGLLDLLEPGDLTNGKKIAATGIIYRNGVIDTIGGVEEKRIALQNQGYDIFFVPKSQLDLVNNTDPSLEVIGVSTIFDVLEELEKRGGDPLDTYRDNNDQI